MTSYKGESVENLKSFLTLMSVQQGSMFISFF